MTDRILEILRAGPATTRDLCVALHSTTDQLRRVLHAMEADGVVRVRGRRCGSYLWRLVTEPKRRVVVEPHRLLAHICDQRRTARAIAERSGTSYAVALRCMEQALRDELVTRSPLGWSLTAAGRAHVRARLGECPAVAVPA